MEDPKVIKIFVVYETINEHGKLGEIVGYAVDEGAAHEYAKHKGWWGGSGVVRTAWGLCVGDKIYALHSRDPIKLETKGQSLRTQALSKLTPAERRELGVE